VPDVENFRSSCCNCRANGPPKAQGAQVLLPTMVCRGTNAIFGKAQFPCRVIRFAEASIHATVPRQCEKWPRHPRRTPCPTALRLFTTIRSALRLAPPSNDNDIQDQSGGPQAHGSELDTLSSERVRLGDAIGVFNEALVTARTTLQAAVDDYNQKSRDVRADIENVNIGIVDITAWTTRVRAPDQVVDAEAPGSSRRASRTEFS
jgi:hypothetical protein